MPPGHLYQFGEFSLDPEERLLFRQSETVSLTPKALDTLLLLVENHGHVVDKDTLLKQIWPETFVEEGSLTRNISTLRKVLGDAADGQHFIETIPKRGYRFVAEVRHTSEAAQRATDVPSWASSVSAPQPAMLGETMVGSTLALTSKGAKALQASWWLWRLLVAVALLPGLVGLLFLLSPWRHMEHSRPVRAFVPAPQGARFVMTGDQAGPVILSPDGSKMAFVASATEGGSLLFVRSLDALSSSPLPGTEGAAFPFWSMDGRSLGFFADRKLKRVDLGGALPVGLADAPTARGGSWSRRGIIIFAPDYQGGLFQVPADGGSPTPVTRLSNGQTGHRFPHFLPDQRHFIYLAVNNSAPAGEQTALYFTSIDGEENRLLTRSDSDAVYASGFILFMRGSTLFAQALDPDRGVLTGDPVPTVERVLYDTGTWKGVFSASETGTLAYQLSGSLHGNELLWLDRTGRPLRQVGSKTDQFNLRLSRDGKQLAVTVEENPTTEIQIYDLALGTQRRLSSQNTADQDDAVWSPDGGRLAFSAKRGGDKFRLYEVDLAGGRVKLLLTAADDVWPTDWSPDGRYLLYAEGDHEGQTRSNIWVLPRNSPEKFFSLTRTPSRDDEARFSPDGHWVTFSSNVSGRDEVYVVAFPESASAQPSTVLSAGLKPQRWQVSKAGGLYPRWRRDGKELFFVSREGIVMVASVSRRSSELVFGSPRPLFRVPPLAPYFSFEISPDGKEVLVNSAAEHGSAPITVVMNWTADLAR